MNFARPVHLLLHVHPLRDGRARHVLQPHAGEGRAGRRLARKEAGHRQRRVVK